MPRYVDVEKIRPYKGFFEKVNNVPKFYEWVESLPTADVVEVRHGEWIFGETQGHSWMKCSECLVSQSGQTATFSYCPNCGAKMRKEAEPLTDEEQRIFLSAMYREEKVCKEVEAKMKRQPYEDSLVRVCREIIRKVKGALWTS